MEKLLNKGHHGVIAQVNAIKAFEPTSLHIHPEKQQVLNTHQQVFDKPHELPPLRGEHDHSITLVPGAQPLNVNPYRYPFAKRMKLKKSSRNSWKLVSFVLALVLFHHLWSWYSRKMGNGVCVKTSGPSTS